MSKTVHNLNESDLRAIADMIWMNNNWFKADGQMLTLSELENEIVGCAEEHAENCDNNAPCMVGE